MSVVRSAYRQILRVGANAQHRYEDPNDLCFAIFGTLLNRNDFANAGYGTDFGCIVRHAFSRPSVVGDASDSPSARLQASFSVLRQLHDLTRYKTPQAVRLRREEVLRHTSSAAKSPLVETPSDEDVEVTVKDGTATVRKKVPTVHASGGGAVEGKRVESADKDDGDDDEEDDEHALVGTTTLFIDRSQNRKVQQDVRHVVVSKVKEHFPPYPYLLPPEPMYPLSVRQEFPFLLGKDAVACIAATSALLQQQQAKRELEDAAELGYRPKRGRDATPAGGAAGSASGLHKRVALNAPTTEAEFQALLESVPTRAVARTDFMEIEVCTQYICSHPPAGTSQIAEEEDAAARGRSGTREGTPPPPASLQGQRAQAAARSKAAGSAKLFMCYVFLRNLSPSQNPKLWHAQFLSQHLTILDVETNEVVEMARPGLVGNFPFLAPGESHVFESGTSQFGSEAILRGTLQVNAFNEQGQMRVMDVALPPVRLSTRVFDYPYHKGRGDHLPVTGTAAVARTQRLAEHEAKTDGEQ